MEIMKKVTKSTRINPKLKQVNKKKNLPNEGLEKIYNC